MTASTNLAPPSSAEDDDPPPVQLTQASDVETAEVRWLWQDRVPRGKITDVCGDPGEGKTSLALGIAAFLSTGVSLPDDKRDVDPQSSLYVTAEDDPEDTLVPRLQTIGADLERIYFFEGVDSGSHPEPLRLDQLDHVRHLRDAVRYTDAALVVLDPITAFLGDTNPHKDADVRSVLRPLAGLASETDAAVVMIRHLRKAAADRAIYRAGGSIGFVAAARSQLLVGSPPNEEVERAVVQLKNNHASIADPVGFTMDGGYFDFRDGTDLTAAQILAAEDDAQGENRLAEAEAFLTAHLSDGPQPSSELIASAADAGISERTLKRAKANLSLEANRYGDVGQDGRWYWLPPGMEALPADFEPQEGR